MRPALLLLILAMLISSTMPAVLADEIRPKVLVGCFDAQTYPPRYLPNFTSTIVGMAEEGLLEAYGDILDVLDPGDWFFLLDAINMPDVVGAVISLTVREGGTLNLPEASVDRLLGSFEAGLGLVGIHGPAYSPYFGRISREVFPIDGDKLAGGKIARVGKILTVRHTHEKNEDHFITEGEPDSFEAADSFLVHKGSQDGSWFVPEEGTVTVLYTAKVGNVEFPSIMAYERGEGRSVIYTGLKHTDGMGGYKRDRDWYNHSLALPEVRSLLGKSIVWTVEPFLGEAALGRQVEDSTAFFEERFELLSPEEELASGEKGRLIRGSASKIAVVVLVSVLLILAIAYIGFFRD
jgi:hypothetical protein